jgi:hypothetical protein
MFGRSVLQSPQFLRYVRAAEISKRTAAVRATQEPCKQTIPESWNEAYPKPNTLGKVVIAEQV